MGKYTPPAVTWHDVMDNLPVMRSPLYWTLGVRPMNGNKRQVSVSLELCYLKGGAESVVWRRWGGFASSTSPSGVMAVALKASMDAYAHLEGIAYDELFARIEWDLGIPRHG